MRPIEYMRPVDPLTGVERADPYGGQRMTITFDVVTTLCSTHGDYAQTGRRIEDEQGQPLIVEDIAYIASEAVGSHGRGREMDRDTYERRLARLRAAATASGLDRDEDGQVVRSVPNVHFLIDAGLAAFDPDEPRGLAYLSSLVSSKQNGKEK